jgi:para-aminobenzoate synthetase component 1
MAPEALAHRIGAWERPAFLEGGLGFGEAGRWSIYAARPRVEIEATDSHVTMRRGRIKTQVVADPLAALADLLDDFRLANPQDNLAPGSPPFQGGMIGHFGYELAPLLERLPRRRPRDSRLPDLRFALYDTWVVYDHEKGRAELGAADLLGEGDTAVARRLEDWLERLGRVPEEVAATVLDSPIVADFCREDYLRAVERALEYVRAGDIFQVNLSQRFSARGRIEPADLRRRLRTISPAPFSAYLAWDDLAIVSASPEWFYQTRGDRIVTRPIKGTRPRGATAEEDLRLRDQLLASDKDRAELTMIVDLERNDLGRVCRYGSVVVTESQAIESYAQVHHLVATVEGRLRPDAGPIDIVRATFPGGSITGAPKVRAMQIIDELEPNRRSAYTGALGFFGQGGASTFNILIRTMLVEGDRVSFQVGGGIVADSDSVAEYDETLHKGRGMREVLQRGGG